MWLFCAILSAVFAAHTSILAKVGIRGVDSNGMLLAAKAGKELKLVTVDGEIASGAQVG